MCLSMYLFSDQAELEMPWNPDAPGLYAHGLTMENMEILSPWNGGNQNGVFTGSYMGCGCGWSLSDENTPAEEQVKKISDRLKLMELVSKIDSKNTSLVVCWEGDQGRDLLGTQTISLLDIANPAFEFIELVKYQVAKKGIENDPMGK